MADPTWTYVIFTDTVHSTEASRAVRARHLEVVKQSLEEGSQYLRLIDGRYVRRVGDEHKAEFTDPWCAIGAALRVQNRTRELDDGLIERIGLDAGLSPVMATARRLCSRLPVLLVPTAPCLLAMGRGGASNIRTIGD